MMRILRYILRHDTGMAPCIDDGMVSRRLIEYSLCATADIF